jgi:Fe-S-cluster-containing dehydrogenase component
MKKVFYKVANEHKATITFYDSSRSDMGCQVYRIEGNTFDGKKFTFWDSYWVGSSEKDKDKLGLIELFKKEICVQCDDENILSPCERYGHSLQPVVGWDNEITDYQCLGCGIMESALTP